MPYRVPLTEVPAGNGCRHASGRPVPTGSGPSGSSPARGPRGLPALALSSASFEQQVLAVVLLEAEPLIEAGAIGGHQIHPLRLAHPSIGEQLLNKAAPQALALQGFRHHHIPEHGPEDAVTGRPAEAHQLRAAPGADHRLAAPQHPLQGLGAATGGPEAVGVEQSLQGAQTQAQAQGQAGMADQADRCGWAQWGQAFEVTDGNPRLWGPGLSR